MSGSSDALVLELAEEAARRGAGVAVTAPPEALPKGAGGNRGAFLLLPQVHEDPADWDPLLEAVLERFPRIDAAIAIVAAPPVAPLDGLSLEEWQRCVIAPVQEVFWLARRVVWEFLATGSGGRLVFIAEPPPRVPRSSGGEETNEVVGAALISLARSIAKEVGSRSVACNVVLPAAGAAAVNEPRASGTDPLLAIVESALFLASDDASFVNGEALVVRL